MNLAQRAAATQQSFDAFKGAPFAWAHSSCAHLLATHLLNMGHDVPAVPPFKSATGARKALRAMGATNLTALLSGLGLQEIKPAAMLVGDLAVVPGDDSPFDAIVVAAGNGKFMGWHGASEGLQMIDDVLPNVKAAFRV